MAFKAYLTGSSQYNKRPNYRVCSRDYEVLVCLVDGGCVCCFETSSLLFLSNFVKNIPGVISLLFVTRSRMLVCDLASSMLSRACILFFCSFRSNSTRRKPAQ